MPSVWRQALVHSGPVAVAQQSGVEKFNDHHCQKFLDAATIASDDDLLEASLAYENRHNSLYHYGKLDGQTPPKSAVAYQIAPHLSGNKPSSEVSVSKAGMGLLPCRSLYTKRCEAEPFGLTVTGAN